MPWKYYERRYIKSELCLCYQVVYSLREFRAEWYDNLNTDSSPGFQILWDLVVRRRNARWIDTLVTVSPLWSDTVAILFIQRQHSFNSLWPSDVIRRYKSGSILVQVMACCLTAASHNLIQYWLIICKVLWHSTVGNLTGNAPDIYPWNELKH